MKLLTIAVSALAVLTGGTAAYAWHTCDQVHHWADQQVGPLVACAGRESARPFSECINAGNSAESCYNSNEYACIRYLRTITNAQGSQIGTCTNGHAGGYNLTFPYSELVFYNTCGPGGGCPGGFFREVGPIGSEISHAYCGDYSGNCENGYNGHPQIQCSDGVHATDAPTVGSCPY